MWFIEARALALLLGAVCQDTEERPSRSRITDEVIPFRVDAVPDRPQPLLELGDSFLGTGTLRRGFELPTSAVWRPSFLAFGQLRTAAQTFDDGKDTVSELATRLDLFGNLQLSGTERLLIGVRPLDQDGNFTRFQLHPDRRDGFEDELNLNATTLFFEGDFGELFPGLDPGDSSGLDYGFSIGRQPLTAQAGLLLDDTIDAVGITRNSLHPDGTSNLRVTGLWGWNEVHRDDNREDRTAQLLGLFSEADFRSSTVSVDAAWVVDEGDDKDALYFGVGAVQRLGHFNTAFRVCTSYPLQDESPEVGRGTLLFAEFSRTMEGSENIAYLNLFWGIDEYSSAARGPDRGGPLGGVGILFAAVGLGRYDAPLGNHPDKAVGGAAGHQWFFDDNRAQVVLEVGGRTDTDGETRGPIAVGARVQRALGRRTILRLDGFVSGQDDRGPGGGLRFEVLVKF